MFKAKKLGVCFTGGGARGAFQVGAMKALDELGIYANIRVFSGTSIGAANATVMASQSIEAAESIWRNLPKNNFPRLERQPDGKWWVPTIEKGIYSMDVFEAVMFDAIDYDVLKTKEVYATIAEAGLVTGRFRDLFKSTYAHYVNHESRVRYMPMHALPPALVKQTVVASCSIPIIFSFVSIHSHRYYDGGIYDNVPVIPLIESGCDVIIVVHLHRSRSKIPDYIKKNEDVTFHEIRHTGREYGKILKFSQAQTERLITLGYDETMAYFNHQANTKSL